MKNKKIFSFKKMNFLGKIGITFAIFFIIMAIAWSFIVGFVKEWDMYGEWKPGDKLNDHIWKIVNGEIWIKYGVKVLTTKWKIIIISILTLVEFYESFVLITTILFVKGKIKSKMIIGILGLTNLIFPGILILLGEGEIEKESIPIEN